MLSGRTQSQTVRPAEPPAILLAYGKFEPEQFKWFVGGGIALLLAGAALVLLSAAVSPGWRDAPVQELFSISLFLIGWLLIVVGAYTVVLPYVREWQHAGRLREWQETTRAAHEAGQGVIVEQELTEWSLRLDSAGAMLAAVVALHRQAERTGQAPSVRTLERGIWIDAPRGGQRRIFDVSNYQARELCGWLAEVGLLDGRAPGQAGHWSPRSLDEAVEVFTRGWSR